MRFLLKLLTRIPLPLLYPWAWLIYFVAFHVMRWRRDRAELDVANALPERTEQARAEIVRRSYRNLADTLIEAFWGFGASGSALKRRVVVENPELVTQCVDAGQSVVLLTAHYGNWEWLLLAAGAHFGIVIDVVYQPQRVGAFDAFLREARSRFGSRLIPRAEFVYDLLSRAEQLRTYALIADQTPKHKSDPRHWTRFLHQETAFFTGAGKIARFLEAKVLYVRMRRVGRGRYSVWLEEIAAPPFDDVGDVEIVERYARSLERDIRESPADWLWLQNKWKIRREADPVAKARP
ncbi:MAG: lysophospholipid acyltransferase family protein [Casimicrobiaceae bacterium]